MGITALPASGDVYVDTDTTIYALETYAPYWSLLQPVWHAAASGQIRLVSSELLILGTLVLPIRRGDAPLRLAYEAFFADPQVRLYPADDTIMREAARFRRDGHRTLCMPRRPSGVAARCFSRTTSS